MPDCKHNKPECLCIGCPGCDDSEIICTECVGSDPADKIILCTQKEKLSEKEKL